LGSVERHLVGVGSLEEGEQRSFGQSNSGLDWWDLVRATIQSTALFVGISVIFGRVYFSQYLEYLNVPSTAVRLNLLEYAVISPNVAIVSVSLAVAIPIAAVNVLRLGRVGLGTNVQGRVVTGGGLDHEKVYFGIALLAAASWLISKYLSVLLNFGLWEGLEGFLTAISALGAILGYSSVLAGEKQSRWQMVAFVERRIRSAPLLTFFLLCILVFLLLIAITADFARSDSDATLVSSPTGVLHLQPDHIPSELVDHSNPSGKTSVPVKILLITEDLVFVASAADTEQIRDPYGLRFLVGLALPGRMEVPEVFAIPSEHIDYLRILSS
jgi:hypothetical protein